MSVCKVYYDSKHPAGFGSVSKLVKASKNKKVMLRSGCQVKTCTLFIKVYVKFFREIHIL